MNERNNIVPIDYVQIKDLTVFEDIEIEFSKGVNVIVGENGTGKTHLLKFLYAVLGGLNLERILGFLSKEVCDNARNKCTMSTVGNLLTYTREHEADSNWTITPNVFIPAKEMLTQAKGLSENFGRKRDMPFDETLLEIIIKARQYKLDEVPELAKPIISRLEDIMDGVVYDDGEHFYIDKRDGRRIPFSLEAEGVKKIGLLWQLLMNEGISKNTVLFWDEPEANINPKLVPVIVDILLELSRQGLQVFVATHDYIFAKYVEVKMREDDGVLFHALHKTDNGVKCETQQKFSALENNSIVAESIRLYKEEVEKVMR